MKNLGLMFTLILVVSRAESKGKKKDEKERMIGKNGITCITFDLLDWKGDFINSKGIYMNNFGVQRKAKCGLDGSCGIFAVPSVLKLPYFTNNLLFEFTLSLWFKRSKRSSGGLPTIYSFGGCGNPGSEILSIDDKHVGWTWLWANGLSNQTFETDSQSTDWRHIVFAARINRVTMLGRAVLYFDGEKIGQNRIDITQGFPSAPGPLHIGGNDCTVDKSRYFAGQMDSVSTAMYYVSAREVKQLYENPGQCVGE